MATIEATVKEQFEEFRQELLQEYLRSNKPVDSEGAPLKTCRFTEDVLFLSVQAVQREKSQELITYLRELVIKEYNEHFKTVDEYDRRYQEANADIERIRVEDQLRADQMMAID